MTERLRHQQEGTGPNPTGLGDPFDSANDVAGIATVRRGVHVENLPVVGYTVGEIRRRFADRFDINDDNGVFINGMPVHDESTVLRPGERIEFTRDAGEKGCGQEIDQSNRAGRSLSSACRNTSRRSGQH